MIMSNSCNLWINLKLKDRFINNGIQVFYVEWLCDALEYMILPRYANRYQPMNS